MSVFVADDHGEVVAAATMDGAAPDTRLNAQRKAYTAARSDATATSALAEKVKDDPVERASFDPFFTFFKGGVAAFDGETRVGAVGVSGLPGEVDEELARARDRRRPGLRSTELELPRRAVALVHGLVRPARRDRVADHLDARALLAQRVVERVLRAPPGRHHDPVRVDLELAVGLRRR